MDFMKNKRPHAGWLAEESQRLFTLAEEAQTENRPLKSVFDEVAEGTGRRPNSVRNYYYARVKESEGALGHRRAFDPFSDEEAALLVEEVLSAQARGESVRACTLRLAKGSDKAMLRYQNKYRSVLKHNKDLVDRVREDMTRRGLATFDPFTAQPLRRVGRPKKPSGRETAPFERVINDLSRVEGLNVNALLNALGALATSAIRGAEGQDRRQFEAALSENEALKGQLVRQQERYRLLLSDFSQLIRINSEFLSQNSVVKVSNLSSYIRDLEPNVRNCQLAMQETGR